MHEPWRKQKDFPSLWLDDVPVPKWRECASVFEKQVPCPQGHSRSNKGYGCVGCVRGYAMQLSWIVAHTKIRT